MDNTQPSPLHLAAYAGSPAAVERLIDAGFMTDEADHYGYTPLHRAVQSGSLETVKALTEAGADPAALVSGKKSNALVVAAQVGAIDIMKWLITEGNIRVDAPGRDGISPLIVAMRYRRYEAANVLLRAGASAECRDPETSHSVAQMYEQQAEQATLMDLSDARHSGLEATLRDKGMVLSLFPPEDLNDKPAMTAGAPARRAGDTIISADWGNAGGLAYSPGATAFFPDLTRPRAERIWHSIKGQALTKFLDRVSPVDGKWVQNDVDSEVRWRHLPWYDTVRLIHVRNPEMDAQQVRLFYFADQGNLFRLNGTSPAIHEVNAKAPIKLDEKNVLDYLRFFCFFVRGDEGPFYIAEDSNDPILPRFRKEASRNIVAATVRPASLEGKNEQGHYLCDAVINYSNAIFAATFAVHPTGMLDMLEDQPIAGDLSDKIGWRLS